MSRQCDAFSRLHGDLPAFDEMPSIHFRNLVEQHILLKQETARALSKAKQTTLSQPDFSSLDMQVFSTIDGYDSKLSNSLYNETSAILSMTKQRGVAQVK